MNETTAYGIEKPEVDVDLEVAHFREHFEGRQLLDQVVHRSAQQMLPKAIEAEAQEFIQEHGSRRDPNGNRLVVRNGHKPAARS